MRHLLTVELADLTRRRLADWQQSVKEFLWSQWVPHWTDPADFHVLIANLPTIPSAAEREAIQRACDETEAFDVRLAGFGWLNKGGFLTFWIGVEENGGSALYRLRCNIATALGQSEAYLQRPCVEIGYCERWFGRAFAKEVAAQFSGVEVYGILPVTQIALRAATVTDSSVVDAFPLRRTHKP